MTGAVARDTYLPAEQDRPQTPAWLPQAHGDQERAPSARAAPRAGPQETLGLRQKPPGLAPKRLKTRADFLRAQRGFRRSTPGLTLEACLTPDHVRLEGAFRVGFTASRKVGGAVERNRAKRRLRAAAYAILPLSAREGHDYVLIARTATISRPFAELSRDLNTALAAIHAAFGKEGPTGAEDAPP